MTFNKNVKQKSLSSLTRGSAGAEPSVKVVAVRHDESSAGASSRFDSAYDKNFAAPRVAGCRPSQLAQ